MSARMRLVHSTGFTYSAPVMTSFNEARITPRNDSRQTSVVDHVDTTPGARQFTFTDYWGTKVTVFDLHTPHDRLEVVGTAVVETENEARSEEAASVDWVQLRHGSVVDEYDEMLQPTVYTPHHPELVEFAAAAAAGLTPAAAAEAVVTGVYDALTYEAGTTEVHSTAIEAWRQRKGVCQDYAHISLVMLRSLGIPARYVSGYLHPHNDAGIGETVEGESHAWIEVWTGGWWGIDPTNNKFIDDHHVSVGTGRDYADLPPIKGIYTGSGESELDVSVRITRLA
ncbi:MAG TPA: transglutaminase family protein [Gordonia sp. (in: high G+C Gram-positive bacteria)]|uniref:transglutaminase family protein n=1 Tax=unclassified Gordonia (in: high G+C Gram-positive bacteria) TaxID=2657482 RepID=UPI000F9E7F58|nr:MULTISPECIES: transglutaminase family protein [unclassified Gordonia (in: high G+C Gram-positive bacteria)]RUP36965.1 MAG: transglutaminase family protein [Gordonia sp. (in: high G+C Gram-positive bacteria)]HNP55815.1 transglutaminase family protein [Gordonia sp. (in: high G+C Gram-positive bacteria)]HRC51574.1 transglutaminase family protein [Gordonia sp. (in: high G+C Gram-positive bacteria)]